MAKTCKSQLHGQNLKLATVGLHFETHISDKSWKLQSYLALFPHGYSFTWICIVEKSTSDTYKMEGLGVNVDDQEGHQATTHVE